MPRFLEGQPAIGYLDEIRQTFERTKSQSSRLQALATLITLQKLYLERRKKEGVDIGLPLSSTGFPSLATLMADVQALLNQYETAKNARRGALSDLVTDLESLQLDKLEKNARERSRRTVLFDVFCGGLDPESLEECRLTVTYWHDRKVPSETFVAVSEENSLLASRLYWKPGRKWENDIKYYKFFYIPPRDQDEIWQSFFLEFLGSTKEPGTHFRKFWIRPERGQNAEQDMVSYFQDDLDKSIMDIPFGRNNKWIEPFDRLLQLYDPTKDPSYNKDFLETIIEVSQQMRRIRRTLGMVASFQKVVSQEKLEKQQLGLVAAIREVERLPADISELILATIKDVIAEEILPLAPRPIKAANEQDRRSFALGRIIKRLKK